MNDTLLIIEAGYLFSIPKHFTPITLDKIKHDGLLEFFILALTLPYFVPCQSIPGDHSVGLEQNLLLNPVAKRKSPGFSPQLLRFAIFKQL